MDLRQKIMLRAYIMINSYCSILHVLIVMDSRQKWRVTVANTDTVCMDSRIMHVFLSTLCFESKSKQYSSVNS